MAASSVVSSVPQHQVFLNFRGEELRNHFVSHLVRALRDKNINVFIDANEAKGQHLDILFKMNEGSRIALAIFSKGYTESNWCLNELVKIRERMDKGKLVTIPIFYLVEPKTVKHQEGAFGDVLRKKKRIVGDDQVNKWEGALKSVCDRIGFRFDGMSNENEFIDKIVQEVLKKLSQISSDESIKKSSDHSQGTDVASGEAETEIYGLKQRLSDLEEIVDIKRDEPRVVGVVGMHGIGKTTLVKEFFETWKSYFVRRCLLQDINEIVKCNAMGLKSLPGMLLKELLADDSIDEETYEPYMKKLRKNKVFIVLDGISDKTQIEVLLEGHLEWTKKGSKIVIATNDRSWLEGFVQDADIYEVPQLNRRDSLKHFHRYAFFHHSPVHKNNEDKEAFMKVSKQFVHNARGHPLALQLLGEELCGKPVAYWEEGLDTLCQSIRGHVSQVSYDELSPKLKDAFLDIDVGEMLSPKSIWDPSQDFDSYLSDKSTTKAPDRKHSNNDWHSFCQFCRNRRPLLNPFGCSANDVIDFLRTQHVSGGIEALVDHLGITIEELGVKPEDNPFRSPAVTSYLKAAREMTQETECILVFSCNDNLDVDETSFIEAISKELHKREVTPLTYNLLGREKLDEEMLYRSRVGIMILSNSYVSSRQSLDHLVAVMEHWKTTDLVIIPIYFKVTLSDICGLKGKFEAAFLQLQRSLQEDRFQKWKAAVTEIVSIGGLEWTKGSQFMLAEEVVRNASLRLYLKNSKNLAGIIALLNPSQSLDAEIVGLWGMAGIGKTSIAREIFEIRAPHYESCYFLQDFHLMCQMKGLTQLRDDFLSKVFGEEKLSIGACDTKLSFMKAWFHNKKILVVLDDVSNARDAEAVVGGFGWFSHGHTIILTSRRKQVLVQCKVKEVYEIQKLCEYESFRLCKQYLNGENAVISELMNCSSGIPLALKVLVSSVSKQHIKNMKEHLQSLRKNPPAQIQEAFRRSFNGLDENEKNIFLDLACFFRGENKDHVVQILDACGFFTCLGICDLIDESLISLLDNGIEMPIPFQDIGRFVVREEDEDPCERSRLWDSSDITDVLINNSGTEAIEGIFLDASDLTCELSPTVFGKMYNLRLLKFYCSTSGNECKLNLPQGLDTLPDELRLLHWENYPLENLPGKFNPENLVEINMPYSNMEKLWEGKKNLEKLKILKLSHSKKLTDIQVLSEAMNLEHIDLEGCTSLVDVSTSIPRFGKLVSLNMKDCSHLRSLPAWVFFASLKLFNFSGCSELEENQELPQTFISSWDCHN